MKKYIDLTHPIHEGMMTVPAAWHPVVEITQLARHCLEGRESYKISVGTHTGTHIDSPAHMIEEGSPRVDKIPLETTIGNAKIMRIPKGSFGKITVEDLVETGINVETGDRIVINTGWYKTWGTKKYFKESPCITKESADWLIRKGVIYILMDIPSPDDPLEKLEFGKPNPIHVALLSKGIFISENLTNLDEISTNEIQLISLPLFVKGVDGSPTRVVAIVE